MSGTAALEPVLEHVRANAGRYLGLDGEPARVEISVDPAGSRPRARLHRLELRAGGRRLRLVAKETSLPEAPEAGGGGDRPRLTVVGDTHERHRYEYLGLRAAEEHFTALRDPRFTVVRAIDHLPEQRVFLMEDVPHPTLRDLLAGPARLTPAGRRRIAAAVQNAGAWLREFHGLAVGDDASPPLRSSPAAVEEALRGHAAFVVAAAADRAVSAAIAAGALTDPLPVGLWHADFAPRNVFVTPQGAVAGFDMAARRRVPVYEDIAVFLVNLRGGRARKLAGLAPRPPRGRGAAGRRFLAGYFGGGPVPERALAIFSLLAALDEWGRLEVEASGLGRAAALRALRAEVAGLCAALERGA